MKRFEDKQDAATATERVVAEWPVCSSITWTDNDKDRFCFENKGAAVFRATPDGRLVDPTQTLQDSGLQSGDSITAVAEQSKVAVTHRAMVFVVRWR